MSFPEADRRRADIEAALARYPEIDAEDVARIKTWFDKEASALDVALLASDRRIAEAYRRFRADHVDRFTPSDLVPALAFLLAIGGSLAALVWLAA